VDDLYAVVDDDDDGGDEKKYCNIQRSFHILFHLGLLFCIIY